MTLKEIITAYPIITKLAGEINLPTKVKYKTSLLLNDLTPSVEFFEKERVELIKKYNTSEEADAITIPTDKMEEFSKEVEDLVATEFDGDIKKGEIPLNVELPITATEMQALLPFFEFTE